jgi:hypothetical protein
MARAIRCTWIFRGGGEVNSDVWSFEMEHD